MTDDAGRIFAKAVEVVRSLDLAIDYLDGRVEIPSPPPEIAGLIDLGLTLAGRSNRLYAEYDYVGALEAGNDAMRIYRRILATGVEWNAPDGSSLICPPWLPPNLEAWAADQIEVGRWRKAGTVTARWNRKLGRFQAEAGSSEIEDGPGWQSDLTRRDFADLQELAWSAPKAVARRLMEMADDLNADKAADD